MGKTNGNNNVMGKRQSTSSKQSRVLRSASASNNHYLNQPRSHAVPIDNQTASVNETIESKDKDKKKKKKKA